MPTLIFILIVSYASAFASTSHEVAAPKNKTEQTETNREPASAKEEITNEEAEKLVSALESVDHELRQIHTGRRPTQN